MDPDTPAPAPPPATPVSCRESREARALLRTYRSTQRRELLDAERDILIPAIKGQLQFIRKQWVEVQEIARRPGVHMELAHALEPLLPPKPGMDADESARAYFNGVADTVQNLMSAAR